VQGGVSRGARCIIDHDNESHWGLIPPLEEYHISFSRSQWRIHSPWPSMRITFKRFRLYFFFAAWSVIVSFTGLLLWAENRSKEGQTFLSKARRSPHKEGQSLNTVSKDCWSLSLIEKWIRPSLLSRRQDSRRVSAENKSHWCVCSFRWPLILICHRALVIGRTIIKPEYLRKLNLLTDPTNAVNKASEDGGNMTLAFTARAANLFQIRMYQTKLIRGFAHRGSRGLRRKSSCYSFELSSGLLARLVG